MKRFLKCLFAMMMVVGLSACSNSEQEQEAIKVVIDSYLGNCKSGDYESADAFLSKDAGSDLEFATVYSELDSQLESMGLGEDFDREARSFVQDFVSKTFMEYKVDGIQVDGDKATANITLNGKDTDEFDLNEIQDLTLNEVTNYINDHTEELQSYAENHTEEELEAKMYKDLSKVVFDKMKEMVAQLPEAETNLVFGLTKEDGDWKITSIQEKQ